jgi:hypothetical protein
MSEKLLKISLFGPSVIHQVWTFQSSSKGSSFNLTFILGNIIYSDGDKSGDYGGDKDCNIFGVQNCQTLATLLAGAVSWNKKMSREQKAAGPTTVLGMFKDSDIIVDAIRWSFFTKSATATMLTSVRVDFGRQLLSSSICSLPSRNRGYYLKMFDRFRDSFP